MQESPIHRLEDAIAEHDEKVAAAGHIIWLGAEPTFTDPSSLSEEWKTAALGADKEARAREYVRILAAEYPGAVVLRTLGRQYPGEPIPRWSFGIYSLRNATPIWQGPADPMLGDQAYRRALPSDAGRDRALLAALGEELQIGERHVLTDLPNGVWGSSLVYSDIADFHATDWLRDPRIVRPPLQSQAIPASGAYDELAAAGVYRVAVSLCDSPFRNDEGSLQVELPAISEVWRWLQLIGAIGRAATRIGLQRLTLAGFPPPVNEAVAWNTVTPDPGVLEINMAPCASVSDFLLVQQRLHACAAEVGLTASQLLYNGDVVDSGGGQHLTFGGPTPRTSPFLLDPRLLPRVIAYLNRHPALSYWFAVRSVGSCGQQPRSDEVSPESFDGLAVALDRLQAKPDVDPETLWRSLAPFLCDRFGNTHRCEINVEKLWNPLSGERGCSGLVELRAFRMLRSADISASVAALMRALIAYLASSEDAPEVIDWGSRLHDRYSLPHYLLEDLRQVLSDLASGGFGLHEAIEEHLLDDSLLAFGTHDLDGAHLTVRQAVEYWPVVGDLSAQNGSFRMMDSSTARLEVMLRLPERGGATSGNWKLSVAGQDVPWVAEREGSQSVFVRGIRYKVFQPYMPVMPLVEVHDPLEFVISGPADSGHWRVRVFNWQPDGNAYDGLPDSFEEAQRRRSERLIVERLRRLPEQTSPQNSPVTPHALTECCVDLRRIAGI